ncbi:hypothetical protein M408DRAFT_330488 [Serendipita vermifera MAFF 305830]|uniref:RING-CH-type domain-containing protein n=1 Tax=Serendipita vermifera MAFF 305830 TaxID=933852 RepID=A0A0C2WJK2_SERVB|nr:hypothetical protein M408DRAFT_330488 [Serendipita vermifera MAFF 305830]
MALADNTRHRPHRTPTISDIRVKQCWICLEEEVSGARNPSSDWCHPCKCSLICHGNCLLQWMTAQETTANRPYGAIKCPQCSTEYTIVSYQPPLLRVFDAIHARVVILGAGVAIGGTALLVGGMLFSAASAYGAVAFAQFIGEKNFNIVYGDQLDRWTAWSFIDWAFIPWSLYTAGTERSFLYNLSCVITACPLSITSSHTDGSLWGLLGSPIASLAIFPILIPVRNLIYNRLKAWVTQKAASPIRNLSSHRPTVRTINNVPGMPGVVVNFVDIRGNAVARVQAAGQQPAAVPVAGGEAGAGVGPGGANAIEAGPVGNNLNRLLRTAGLGTAVIKPLFVPWIAKGMGTALLGLSNQWRPLQSLLFVKKTSFPSIRIRSPGRMFSAAWTWNDLDPVWWRNSLGYLIFNIFSDGLQLWYTYLIERERQSRRVVSHSFENLDPSTLDLIPEI